METNLLISIIGILVFATIMHFGFKYANGKWKVSESKKNEYLNWTNKHGKKKGNNYNINHLRNFDDNSDFEYDLVK